MKVLTILILGLTLAINPVQAQTITDQIKKGNTLTITIKGVPTEEQAQINGNYHVGATGVIKLPLTGTLLKVRGMTNDQVERKIEAIYKSQKIYKEPVIEVIVNGKDDAKARTLSVGGHVKRAGAVQWRDGMTVQQAIQAAGDKDQFGSKWVFLTRAGKKYRLNTSTLAHQNIKVLPNDTLEVKQVGPLGDF